VPNGRPGPTPNVPDSLPSGYTSVAPVSGTPIDREKLLSIGHLRRGRTRAKVREGREHHETGKPFKATTDELGNTTTEHATKDDRVDIRVRVKPIHLNFCAAPVTIQTDSQ